MDVKQRAALAEWNATRPARSPRPPIADALDTRRVARANAREGYRAAVQRAMQQLVRDYARADAAWIIAANAARSAAEQRRSIRARFREMGPIPLREEYSRLAYMLTPAYSVYTNPLDKAMAKTLAGMRPAGPTRSALHTR